jgi:hypothetical protein
LTPRPLELIARTVAIILSPAVVLAAPDDGPGTGSIRIGQNFRLYPSNVTQTETFIVRHPGNPAILFASANTIDLSSGFLSEGIYVSTNAGATWRGTDTCTGAPLQYHRGDPGIAIDKNGTFVLIRLGFFPGLYSHYSTDNGLTWSSQRTIATMDQDRATLVSDGEPTSNHYGRSYAVWVQFAPPYPVMCVYSDNGGATWTAPAPINNPPQRCQGGEAAIGPDGTVYATWAGVIAVSPFTEDHAGFGKSTDGGVNWIITEVAFDMNGIAGIFPEKANIRVNGLPRLDVDVSGGSRNGWIYVATTERNLSPAGSDPDIILHRSTNGGQTWSAGVRVNQDALNNGKFQYFPVVHVDHTGAVNVLYYDDRTTTSDSASVFLSRSVDGGFTWADFEIASHHFRPTPISLGGQGYQGDNIAMTSLGDTLWPVWMDNSSGLYQAWTCPIDINELTSVDADPTPITFGLDQNFPNPFNPETGIRFTIEERGFVSLTVYDLVGREVAELAGRVMEAGSHRVVFDASGLPSGVYYYRLTSAAGSAVKKMILLK